MDLNEDFGINYANIKIKTEMGDSSFPSQLEIKQEQLEAEEIYSPPIKIEPEPEFDPICGLCKQTMISIGHFVHHEHHHHQILKCPGCDQLFDKYPFLLAHIRVLHKDQGSFKCPNCNHNAKVIEEWWWHQRRHKQGQGPPPKFGTVSWDDEKKRFARACAFCPHTSNAMMEHETTTRIVHHMRQTHNYFPCQGCSYIATSQADHDDHLERAHVERGKFVCRGCKFIVATLPPWNAHFSQNPHEDDATEIQAAALVAAAQLSGCHAKQKAFQCPRCDFSADRVASFVKHFEQAHGAVHCTMCDSHRASTPAALERHIQQQHRSASRFKCSLCPWRGVSLCFSHTRHHKRAVRSQLNAALVKGWQRHEAATQRRSAPAKSTHFLVSRGLARVEGEFIVCTQCSYGSSKASSLKIHLKGAHRIYTCIDCPMICQSDEELSTHVRKVHMSEDGWLRCSKCPKYCARSMFSWTRHVDNHLAEDLDETQNAADAAQSRQVESEEEGDEKMGVKGEILED